MRDTMERSVLVGAVPPTPLKYKRSWICTISSESQVRPPHSALNRTKAALSIAQKVDPSFSKERMCFSDVQLLEKLDHSQPGELYYRECVDSLSYSPYNLGTRIPLATEALLTSVKKHGAGLILVSSRDDFAWNSAVLEARDTSILACCHDPRDVYVKWYEISREPPMRTFREAEGGPRWFVELQKRYVRHKIIKVFPVVDDMKIIRVHVGEPTGDLWAQYSHAVEEYRSGQI